MEAAAEPGSGVVEGNCLKGAQRRTMEFEPGFPESIVVNVGVEKDRQFTNMVDNPVIEKDVAEDMKREIPEMVNRRQAWTR
jgi:hypothetical protein